VIFLIAWWASNIGAWSAVINVQASAQGKAKDRTSYHGKVKPGNSPKPAFNRTGHKTSNLCSDCGYLPLCSKVRFHTANAKTCWEIWHSAEDLMSGMGETLCDVENPKVSLLGLAPARVATGTKRSIAGMTKATGKRGKWYRL
jgi:hypothetical protein